MPSSSCTKCGRLISISTLPGGNPVALAEPEVWATSYGFCRKCRKYFCDRCCSINQHCSQYCSASHSLMEERIQGGEPETLKRAIEIMLLSEQTVRMLDKKGAVCMTTSGERLTFSSQLNRRHGWPCKSCGQIMSHSYLVNEGRKIGLYALQR